ncbi:hypothetical protein AAHZ94_19250 [Streptomyces sp. HSW2009]|uniref:hypothetical protein n=1 Tax=Streptomyces sp. HSW2009 TaxID=3142890 RepID=UPI0032EDC1CF
MSVSRRRTAAVALATAGLCALLVPPADAAPTEAECRTSVRGSLATAVCFNPDADADRVQLHVECARWWDPDVDGRPVEVGPARAVTLADRCWMEIRGVWVTHA